MLLMATDLPTPALGSSSPAPPNPIERPTITPVRDIAVKEARFRSRREVLIHRVRFLVAFTIAYNVIEAVIALFAGSAAGSTALVGFGLDSVIEVSSAAAVAWQFSGGDHEARERTALRVIAFSFFGLAAFVTYDAVTSLISGHVAEHSSVEIGLAALSLLIMPARPGSSAAPAPSSAPTQPSPIPNRPCCAPTCPQHCCSGWSPTVHSAGGGPTRSPRCSSPSSRSARASTRGVARSVARPRKRSSTATSIGEQVPLVGDAAGNAAPAGTNKAMLASVTSSEVLDLGRGCEFRPVSACPAARIRRSVGSHA